MTSPFEPPLCPVLLSIVIFYSFLFFRFFYLVFFSFSIVISLISVLWVRDFFVFLYVFIAH